MAARAEAESLLVEAAASHGIGLSPHEIRAALSDGQSGADLATWATTNLVGDNLLTVDELALYVPVLSLTVFFLQDSADLVPASVPAPPRFPAKHLANTHRADTMRSTRAVRWTASPSCMTWPTCRRCARTTSAPPSTSSDSRPTPCASKLKPCVTSATPSRAW